MKRGSGGRANWPIRRAERGDLARRGGSPERFSTLKPNLECFSTVVKVFRHMRPKSTGGAVFQERTVPAGSKLVGWSLLAHHLGIPAPVRKPSCVSDQHVRGSSRQDEEWTVFDRRYWPGEGLFDHLSFALRNEPIDLLIIKRVLEARPKAKLTAFIREAPTGIPNRRAWYFYETLTGRTLDLKDAPNVVAVDLLDPAAYFTGKPRPSKRHRVRDNLLGSGRFSPIIRRTDALEEFVALDLSAKARETVGRTGAHLVARAASFLLLADSRDRKSTRLNSSHRCISY